MSASSAEAQLLKIDITGLDRSGLINQVCDILFSLGANLADTNFATLGNGCHLSLLSEFAEPVKAEDIESALKDSDCLDAMELSVKPFPFLHARRQESAITHRLYIDGGDRPGLVQRISEIVVKHKANIVRLSAHREHASDGYQHYITRFALNVPDGEAKQLDNEVANIAGSLRLNARLVASD